MSKCVYIFWATLYYMRSFSMCRPRPMRILFEWRKQEERDGSGMWLPW